MKSHGNVSSWCDKFFDDLCEWLLDSEEFWSHPVFSWICELLRYAFFVPCHWQLPQPACSGCLRIVTVVKKTNTFIYPFSALLLSVGWQEWHPACNKMMLKQSLKIPLEAFEDRPELGVNSQINRPVKQKSKVRSELLSSSVSYSLNKFCSISPISGTWHYCFAVFTTRCCA